MTSSQNVYLSSESHFALFKHDAEIHKLYKGELEAASERIRYLELKLQDQESHLRERDLLQKRLYDSERTRKIEVSARLRVQCHLDIEQKKSLEFAQEVRNLQEYLHKMTGDYTSLQTHSLDIISAITTCNDKLRGETNKLHHQAMHNQAEIIHNQRIINSLADKISSYDENAEKVLEYLQSIRWKLNDSKRSVGEADIDDSVLKKSENDVGLTIGISV